MILGYPGIPLWPAHNPLSSTLCPPCGDFRGCHGGEPLDHKVESLMAIRFENFSGEQGQLDLIRIDFKNVGFLPWSSTEGNQGCQRHSSYQSINGGTENLTNLQQAPDPSDNLMTEATSLSPTLLNQTHCIPSRAKHSRLRNKMLNSFV